MPIKDVPSFYVFPKLVGPGFAVVRGNIVAVVTLGDSTSCED